MPNKLEIDFKRREGDHKKWDLMHNAHVLVNDREMYVSGVDLSLKCGETLQATLAIDVKEFKRFLSEHAELTLEIDNGAGNVLRLDRVRFIEGAGGTAIEIEGGPESVPRK